MILQPIDFIVYAWLIIAVLSAIYVAYDQFRYNPEAPVMKQRRCRAIDSESNEEGLADPRDTLVVGETSAALNQRLLLQGYPYDPA
jgi:hypothetical protein